jgi:hypothetical protein
MDVARETRSKNTPASGLLDRSKVVGRCLAAWSALLVALGLYGGELRTPIAILAGPFAEQLVFPADHSWTRMLLHAGVILLLAAAHPTRPHPLTALISVCAISWWFLAGFAFCSVSC